MKSVGAMVKQLEGLHETGDVTPWENEFIASVVLRSNYGSLTQRLSEKQVEIIERIYKKHFGDAA